MASESTTLIPKIADADKATRPQPKARRNGLQRLAADGDACDRPCYGAWGRRELASVRRGRPAPGGGPPRRSPNRPVPCVAPRSHQQAAAHEANEPHAYGECGR